MAANRDEMADRPCLAPARHWPDRPGVVAGLDVLAGGTWLGINDDGVVAGVLNRVNTLGPAPGFRSRGELPLQALGHRNAAEAAAALSRLDAADYRPFNLVVVDRVSGFWVRGTGPAGAPDGGRLDVTALPDGLSMITAYDCDDPASPRIRRFRPRFLAAGVPDPGTGDWSAWVTLLAARDHDAGAGPGGAMTVITETGFGTVSLSLIAMPEARQDAPVWLFAAGRPGEVPPRSIALR